MPPNLIGGWAATEKNLTERRPFIQKGLNALYGALEYMRNNPDYAIKTIATNNELPMEIAKMEYEKTYLRLSRDGKITQASVEKAMELAAASGVKDMAPAAEVFMNLPITPTKP
jgi:NitT/TauT family transport system substrate-binding protein